MSVHADEVHDDTDLQLVELDALVVMKILKHCRSNLPSVSSGILLGLDVGSDLQVEEKFGEQNFRVFSEMRIFGQNLGCDFGFW